MKISSLYWVALLSLSSTPAFAEKLTIINNTDQDLITLTAKPGTISGFHRIGPGNKRTFELTMPKGECNTVLRAFLHDSQNFKVDAEVCGGFTWSFGVDVSLPPSPG